MMNMMQKSRQASKASMISSVPEEAASTNDRVLLYPKGFITISLDIPRSKSMFVIVKTKVLDDIVELGRTDSHETLGDEIVTFDKVIEITYFSGVDDHQLVIFEIMDGDIMTTSAFGYIFATVSLPVGELFRGHNRCLVGRGDEHLGFIDLKTTLDVKAESMNIHNQDKRPMAFFQSSAPSDQDIRAMYPSYNNPLGMYSLELLCRDICNEPDDVMADSGYVLVRACLNVEELVMPTSSITYLPSDSSKLKVIWKSQKNYQKPYSINALEIKFNHTELTGELFFEKVLARDTQRKLKIIVDVWVGGTEGDSAPPIRISYCAYSVYKLLEAAGYPKKGFYSTDSSLSVWSKPLPRSLIRVARLRPHKESESDEENSGPGFLTKLFQKKQIDDGVTDVTDENEKSGIDDQKHAGVFAAFKKTKKEKLSDSVDATSVRASHSGSSNGIIQRTRTISNQGQDDNQPSEEEKMQAGGGPGPRSRTDSGIIPSAANENDFEYNENNGNERNERKNSILSTIEKEKEKATRLEEEKLHALEMLTSTSTKPLTPYVKKVKLKPLKLNPDFVREMAAATSYRDPFYERLQLAKLTKKLMEEEMKEEHDHPNRREPDEGEVKKVETDKWAKRLAKRIRKGKKENESAKSEGVSSDDEGFRNEKRKKSLTGVKKKNAGNTLSKSQSFTSKSGMSSGKRELGAPLPEDVGNVTVRIKCFPTNMVYRPGDVIYENRIKELFEVEEARFVVQTKKSFEAAVTRQSRNNKDAVYLLEALAEGRYVQPSFLVDVHAPSVQGLYYGLGLREKKVVATSSTFSDSNVLNTMKEVYRIISFFALDGELLALAGGGVMPPIPPSVKAPKVTHAIETVSESASQKSKLKTTEKQGGKHYYGHPSAGLPRSVAFPLCQEYLLAHSKQTINIANAPLHRPHHHTGKSRFGHHQHHQDHKLSTSYKDQFDDVDVDEEGNSSALVKRFTWTEKSIYKKYDARGYLQKCWKRSKTNPSFWGGKGYVTQSTYNDVASLGRGFMDATSLYCPSLVPVRSAYSAHNSECGSVTTLDAAEEEQAKATHKLKNVKKIRAVRSGITTRVNKTGAEFWSGLPSDLLRRSAYNADVETIELLLAQASQRRTGKCLNLVVWILGVCPPPEALEKASRLFQCQAKSRDETALLIVLASETEVELDEESEESLKRIAAPFKPLIACYTNAVAKAVGHRGEQDITEDEDEFDGTLHVRHGKKLPATSRMMMQHWMSWQEIIAQAYLFEEKTFGKNKHQRSASAPTSPVQKKKKSVLGRLALKKVPLQAVSVAPKNNDQLKEVEKDEYPTHLSMRHILTDRGFVGLSHFAVDRVLGASHTLRKDPTLLPPEDGGVEPSRRPRLFKMFKQKSNRSNPMSQPGSFKSLPLTARTEDGVVGGGVAGVGGEGGRLQVEGGGGGGEGSVVDRASESKKRALYQNFKSEKAKAKAQNKKQDTLHIDVEDATEKARQKDEARRESMHERNLSHRRIEGFAELMAAKERFEFERRLVQRAEVRRFMCQVFLDMTALEDERKNEKGFFAEMSDYVTCNLGPYSVEPPVRASRTPRTSRTTRSSHHGKKSDHDADGGKHGMHSESVEAVLLKSSQDPVQVQGNVLVQDTACVMS